MRKAKVSESKDPYQSSRPALSPEARENQLIAMATDLAERQLREGTASSQVITHYLKSGSTRERLERERLAEENKLLRAKIENLQSAKRVEELFSDAIKAFGIYSGKSDEDDDDEDEIIDD